MVSQSKMQLHLAFGLTFVTIWASSGHHLGTSSHNLGVIWGSTCEFPLHPAPWKHEDDLLAPTGGATERGKGFAVCGLGCGSESSQPAYYAGQFGIARRNLY